MAKIKKAKIKLRGEPKKVKSPKFMTRAEAIKASHDWLVERNGHGY